jgi:hypothetical protein
MNISKLVITSLKYMAFVLLGLIFLTIGQLGQYFNSHADLRLHVINEWADLDSSRSEIAERFISTCINGRSDDIGRMPKGKVMSLYECGETIGASQLVSEIKKSDGILKTFAWPLSTLN